MLHLSDDPEAKKLVDQSKKCCCYVRYAKDESRSQFYDKLKDNVCKMIDSLHKTKMIALIIIVILIAAAGALIRYYDPHN